MGYLSLMNGMKVIFACLLICPLLTGCVAAAAVGLVAQAVSAASGAISSATGGSGSASPGSAINTLGQAASTPVMEACTAMLSNPAAGMDVVQPATAQSPAPDPAAEPTLISASDVQPAAAPTPEPACGMRRVCLPGRATPTTMHMCERRRGDDFRVTAKPVEGGIARWGWANAAAPDQTAPDVSSYWTASASANNSP